MTRALAGLTTLVAGGALVLAGWQLAAAVQDWRAGPAALPDIVIPESQAATIQSDGAQEVERNWLPIFGVARRDVAETPVAAPRDFPFKLKGVVASGNMRWAVLTGGGRDILVREGDTLDGGEEILAIQPEGLDVQLADGVLTLGFAQDAPVEVERLDEAIAERPVTGEALTTMLPPPEATELIFQDITAEEVLAILQQAEAQRRERGIVLDDQ